MDISPPERDTWNLTYEATIFPGSLLPCHGFKFQASSGFIFGFQFIKPTKEEAAEVMADFLQQMLIELRMQFPVKQSL